MKYKLLILFIVLICLQSFADNSYTIAHYYKLTNLEQIQNGLRIELNNEITFEINIRMNELYFPDVNGFPVIWIDSPADRKEFFDLLKSGIVVKAEETSSLEIEDIIPAYQLYGAQYYDVRFIGGLTLRNVRQSRNISEVFPLDDSNKLLYTVSDELQSNIITSILRQSRSPAVRRSQPVFQSVTPVSVTKISSAEDKYSVIFNKHITVNEIIIERNRIKYPEIDGKPVLNFSRQPVGRQIMMEIIRNEASIDSTDDLQITDISIQILNRGRLKAMANVQFNNAFEVNDIRVFFSAGSYSIAGPSIRQNRKWIELVSFSSELSKNIIDKIKENISE